MSQLRTSTPRPHVVVKVFVTFIHGLMFTLALTAVALFSAGRLFGEGGELVRYGRAPSASERAAGRIWFDAPIEATVPIEGAEVDRWNGCALERQRYTRVGKRSDWELQRAYSYGAASVHSDGRAYAVPLHSVSVGTTPGRVLSSTEARQRMGRDLPSEDVAALEWSGNQIGAVRYVEKCVKPGQWLFFDGTIESSYYHSRVAQVSAGPTLRSRRLSFVDLCTAGVAGILAPLAYLIALVFLWGAPVALVKVLRRRAHVAEQSDVSWTTLVLVSLVVVVGAASIGTALQVPFGTTVPAIAGAGFLCVGAFARARRRALFAIPHADLHEARVVAGDVAVRAPLENAPVAAWFLEVFRIGAKGAETRVAVLDSSVPIRVQFTEPSGPGEVHLRDAALDLPAIDVQRSGAEVDTMHVPGHQLDTSANYRLREGTLPVGSSVMVVGAREKQALHRPEAVDGAGYRGLGFESVVRSTDLDRVVVIEGSRASLTQRIAKDAAKLRAVGVIATIGVVVAVASVATSMVLAIRL